MQTYLDCIPCFFRMGLAESRLEGADESEQKYVVDRIARLIPELPETAPPPEMALTVHTLIREIIKSPDPYKEIKKRCNDEAMKVFPFFNKRIQESDNPLLKAVELSIAGNIIDYGANSELDLRKEMDILLEQEESRIEEESDALFSFSAFKDAIEKGKKILIIGDNAGEIVFDRFLIQAIRALNAHASILYAVRDKPIINDITMEDALYVGIDKDAEVLSSGCPAPGTILPYCSEEFLQIFREADVVISKGQGNYEGLSDADREIFFLLRAKCHVIARDVGGAVGDFILYQKK